MRRATNGSLPMTGPSLPSARASGPQKPTSYPPSPSRFDAGFNKGWDDAGNGQDDEAAATEAHKEQVGDHPREWQFTRASSLSPPSLALKASVADGLPPPPFLSRQTDTDLDNLPGSEQLASRSPSL